MKLIYLKTTEAYYNLAAEEYFFTILNEPVFMFWQNSDSIIVGKNQNTLSQINYDAVRNGNIPVVRRLSGGGAVFHDMGNLNYTYIIPDRSDLYLDFKFFSEPIISVLKTLGINAVLSGRNDIYIADKKISGNAQYIKDNKILHHGTLLFQTNLNKLEQYLQPDPEKIQSKGIDSIRNAVTNINEHVKTNISPIKFKDLMFGYLAQNYNGVEIYEVKKDDETGIRGLRDYKYGTWEWNYGYSPKYSFHKKLRFGFGQVEINLDIVSGEIKKAKIYGDFFALRDVEDFENIIIGCKHSPIELKNLLENMDYTQFFAAITLEQLIECLF